MDVSSFMGGNFFTHLDLVQPYQLMTMSRVDQQLVGQGQKAEQKICVLFAEHTKPLALNKTNIKRIAGLHSRDASRWIGQRLLVYRSSTRLGDEVKRCVRVCGPQQAPPDAICDPQGNVVFYQPIAAAAPGPEVAPGQPPAAVPQAAAPAPAPVEEPPPTATAPQQQQPVAAPWEQHDQQQQNNPPGA